MTKYILVEVYEREIAVYQYDNLMDAQRDLCNSFNDVFKNNELEEGADCYLSSDNMYAWANTRNGNSDWQIEKIN